MAANTLNLLLFAMLPYVALFLFFLPVSGAGYLGLHRGPPRQPCSG